jgi:hypothetical protein
MRSFQKKTEQTSHPLTVQNDRCRLQRNSVPQEPVNEGADAATLWRQAIFNMTRIAAAFPAADESRPLQFLQSGMKDLGGESGQSPQQFCCAARPRLQQGQDLQCPFALEKLEPVLLNPRLNGGCG